MALQIKDLPEELLCMVLNLLDTNEKFSGRLVCSSWKAQIDQHVYFNIELNDENYESTRRKFETFRLVRSISIFDYSHKVIPVNDLESLQNLSLGSSVHASAVTQLLSKPKMLTCLKLLVNHVKESATIKPTATAANNYPALGSVKELHIGYGNESHWCERAWNEILYGEMPNVHRLVVDLRPNIPRPRGFDYFRLAAGMPKLRVFTYKIRSRTGRRRYRVRGDEQPLTPTISTSLCKVNLTQLTVTFSPKDGPIWGKILAQQHQMQKLRMFNERHSTEGFPISMIIPVLDNNKESLTSISLQIDTKKSGEIDMKIFANLSSLRELFIQAWPIPDRKNSGLLCIRNCSFVVSETLQKLYVKGFKFSEEDIITFITNVSNEVLDKVQICPEFSSVLKSFEEHMDEMGIVRYGNSAVNPSRHFLPSSNATKVYVGVEIEKSYNYEFPGFVETDFSRRVQDVILHAQSLKLTSRYMHSYK